MTLRQPVELWAPGAQPRVRAYMERTDRSWAVDWSVHSPDECRRLWRANAGNSVEFHTSGSTGEPARWLRSATQLWDEAGLVADLVAPDRIEEMLSFAPPSHLYGALMTGLLGARLGVPMRYVAPGTPLPRLNPGRRLLVVAIPTTFTVLAPVADQLARLPWITFLHSTAMLPASAPDLLARIPTERRRLVEIFGATETGAIATRAWSTGPAGDWILLPDVALSAAGDRDGERPLVVTGPRLARRWRGDTPTEWATGDWVRQMDERRFVFAGRRERLVKVNGRRVDLDDLERALVARVPCRDIACFPIRDPIRGEALEIRVVPGESDIYPPIADVVRGFGVVPRSITVVPAIARSSTGKAVQPT